MSVDRDTWDDFWSKPWVRRSPVTMEPLGPRRRSEIPAEEWDAFEWIDVTSLADVTGGRPWADLEAGERVYRRGLPR